MFQRIALGLLLIALGALRPAHAQLAVLDHANLAESIRQTIYDAQHLAQMYRDYQAFLDQYADMKVNWKSYLVGRILLNIQTARDDRMGYSMLRIARYLEPGSNWRNDIESLLGAHFKLYDRTKASALLTESWRYRHREQAALDRVQYDYDARTPLTDPWHFMATQRVASRRRYDHLNELQGQLGTMGDRSEVAQLQTISAGVTTLAAQNEAVLDSLQMVAAQNAYGSLYEQSERQRALALEARRIRNWRPVSRPQCGAECTRAW